MTAVEALQIIEGELDRTPLMQKQKEYLKRSADVYYGISLHTTGACPKYRLMEKIYLGENYFGQAYQDIFVNRLLARHPREGDETFQWRLSQYKPISRTPFMQVIELINSAIFQDSNYNIELLNEQDNGYIWENSFDGFDIVGWITNIFVQSMVEDPNGLMLRLPELQEVGSKPNVKLLFVKSINIIFQDNEDLIFKYDGNIFHITTDSIVSFTFDSEQRKWRIDEDSYYFHGLGYLPMTRAGGVWNTQGFYDSYLVKAKAVADEFVTSYSSEQLVDKEASHPFIVMVEPECPTCRGTGRTMHPCETCEGGVEESTCTICHGTGLISNNPGERKIVPYEEMDRDHVRITNPDITINSYHHAKNNDLYDRILDGLNLLKVDAAQSGVAKSIDQERLYLFISDIANHLFDDIITATIKDIIAYRNVVSRDGVVVPDVPIGGEYTIVKPTQYSVKTSADLLEDYRNGKDAGLPIFVRQKAAKDYIDKQYSGDEILKKKEEVISELDMLYCYTELEKQTALLSGAVTRENLQKSVQIPFIIERLIKEKGEVWFYDSDMLTLQNEIESRYKLNDQRQVFFNDFEPQ